MEASVGSAACTFTIIHLCCRFAHQVSHLADKGGGACPPRRAAHITDMLRAEVTSSSIHFLLVIASNKLLTDLDVDKDGKMDFGEFMILILALSYCCKEVLQG
uniref:EF-hand domain-containing protein n=1 Tax=Echeneis naucrates TaxID=173247 RepID=A0A665T5U3_ECHNA